MSDPKLKIKNHKQKMFLESADRTPHYGIRKFTVGVVSALLSTTLWMAGNVATAHADTASDPATAQEAADAQFYYLQHEQKNEKKYELSRDILTLTFYRKIVLTSKQTR